MYIIPPNTNSNVQHNASLPICALISLRFIFSFFFSLVECAKKTAELLTIETKRREIIDFHFHSVVFVSVFGCCLLFGTQCYPCF